MIAFGWQTREHVYAVGTVVADRPHSLRHGSMTSLERPPLGLGTLPKIFKYDCVAT